MNVVKTFTLVLNLEMNYVSIPMVPLPVHAIKVIAEMQVVDYVLVCLICYL